MEGRYSTALVWEISLGRQLEEQVESIRELTDLLAHSVPDTRQCAAALQTDVTDACWNLLAIIICDPLKSLLVASGRLTTQEVREMAQKMMVDY